jgi:hypothetical protein
VKNILNLKQAKKFVDFLEENKSVAGLNDWKMRVSLKEYEDEKDPNTIARCVPDYLEKELTVYLTKAFLKLESYRQINILLHELIHGRICVTNNKIKEFKDSEEELMVNDLTRGLETLYEFKL